MEFAESAIGHRSITEFEATHSWLTEEILKSQKRKRDAKGTELEAQITKEHSALIQRTREKFIEDTRQELHTMKGSSKLWWKRAGNILGEADKLCSIPALKDDGENWVMDSKGKANLFATTFSEKY